jgi:3-deoxy-manno-octulosonate cytidylyltransferase (CMP-KDO synthetase)
VVLVPSGFAIVLPARYGSSRFPGKPLALVSGRPLIEWVFLRAREVPGATRVVVATDHEGIADAARGFGAEVVMTSARCRTGTDRVAEAARTLQCDPIVNLQGDEPVFPPDLVAKMVETIRSTPGVDIVTACHPVDSEEEYRSPHAVKVVSDSSGRALYFSRSPIPYFHPDGVAPGSPGTGRAAVRLGHRHIGIYVYRASSLFRFTRLPQSPLEISERLEQLRALEHGMWVQVVESSQSTVGVDVPEDVKKVEKALGGA